jgi:hypothetical protein
MGGEVEERSRAYAIKNLECLPEIRGRKTLLQVECL